MQTQTKPMWLACVLSQAVWSGCLIVFLLISCGAANTSEDPGSLVVPLSFACQYLSALFSGIAAVRFSGDGILSGILSGTLTALLILLLSCLPLPASGIPFPQSLVYTLLVIPCAATGAVIGHKRKNRRNPGKKNSRIRR